MTSPNSTMSGQDLPKSNFKIGYVLIILMLIGFGFFGFIGYLIGSEKQDSKSDDLLAPTINSELPTATPVNVSAAGIDGNEMAYVKNVYENNDRYYVDLDFVQWISDENGEATKACLEDGECTLESCEGITDACMPNGFYIRNRDQNVDTYEMNSNSLIEVLGEDNSSKLEYSLLEFVELYLNDPFRITIRTFDITIIDGEVAAMSEIYTP